jgi:hypothetical protein
LHDGPAPAGGPVAGEGAARWRVTCECRLADEWIRFTVRYRIRSPLGDLEQRRTMTAPLWLSGDGTRDSRDERNVWDLGNLERGRTLRTRFGANLPLGYPVLASYRNGLATAIHSMDLSPYGWDGVSGAEAELSDWIDGLAGFEGTASPWGEGGIRIPPGSIRSRHLLLIVPTNVDEARFAPMLERARIEAQGNGIGLSVVRYQERHPPVAGG